VLSLPYSEYSTEVSGMDAPGGPSEWQRVVDALERKVQAYMDPMVLRRYVDPSPFLVDREPFGYRRYPPFLADLEPVLSWPTWSSSQASSSWTCPSCSSCWTCDVDPRWPLTGLPLTRGLLGRVLDPEDALRMEREEEEARKERDKERVLEKARRAGEGARLRHENWRARVAQASPAQNRSCTTSSVLRSRKKF